MLYHVIIYANVQDYFDTVQSNKYYYVLGVFSYMIYESRNASLLASFHCPSSLLYDPFASGSLFQENNPIIRWGMKHRKQATFMGSCFQSSRCQVFSLSAYLLWGLANKGLQGNVNTQLLQLLGLLGVGGSESGHPPLDLFLCACLVQLQENNCL